MRLKFGVDHNAKWEPLFRLLHQPDACFLHGDINDPATFEPWLKEVASMVFCVQESAAMLIPSWVISLA